MRSKRSRFEVSFLVGLRDFKKKQFFQRFFLAVRGKTVFVSPVNQHRRTNEMKNNQITIAFFAEIDYPTKTLILQNIANHYNITTAEAHEEVTDPEAEHLLDYVTGPQRAATSLLMKRHGFA